MNIQTKAGARTEAPLAVSVKEMCRRLGIGNTLAWQLIGAGRVKTFTIGRKRLVVFSSIEDLIASETKSGGRTTSDIGGGDQ